MTDIKFNNPHEEYCFNNAAYFTACRGNRIQQTFKRIEFDSFDAAVNYGRQKNDGRTMIYAVTAQGRDAHICNA